MEEDPEKYLFEKMPVPRAVATLAVPTILSQVVVEILMLPVSLGMYFHTFRGLKTEG